MKFIYTLVLLIILGSCSVWKNISPRGTKSYTWKNVQISGGGFVTGIVFHPTEKDLRYCRTDMGGAYRWNASLNKWEPLLDWISYEDSNLMGIESIALDPSDAGRLYLACGTYTNSRGPNAILISDNRGKTFKRVDVPFRMGGNENGRGNGERLTVDPTNPNNLYMGTRLDGLWKSSDRGITWGPVSTFPDVTEARANTLPDSNRGSGIVFVVFDTSVQKKPTIYAGCSLRGRDNLFRSRNGGVSWEAVPGQPVKHRPNHIAIASDGNLYITYGSHPGPDSMVDGAVWKLNPKTGLWTEITPDKPLPEKQHGFGYAAVSVDANNPQTLIVSTFNRYGNKGGENIFRSTNGGQTWRTIIGKKSTFDNSLAPYIGHTGVHWLFDIEINPSNPDHAIFTTGYGGHETFNLTDADEGRPVYWKVMSTGIEETVALDLISPPQGAALISGIGDYGGFTHWNLDKPAPQGNFLNPHFGNTDDIDLASKNPAMVVRVGRKSNEQGTSTVGYSTDSGKTWQPVSALPDKNSRSGYVSVSADGKTWIWTPAGESAYRTQDKGNTWTKIAQLPNNTRVIADPVNSGKFYAIDLFNGKFFSSANGGSSFTEAVLHLPEGLPKRSRRGDIRGGQDKIYATPGKEGDLWLAAFDGLYRISDTGTSSGKNKVVQEVHAFGFGNAAPGKKYPAIYLVGTVNKVRGIFRSDDTGENWRRINDDQHQWGLILQITGDPKKHGRVYVGTHGRGILYGDPL